MWGRDADGVIIINVILFSNIDRIASSAGRGHVIVRARVGRNLVAVDTILPVRI